MAAVRSPNRPVSQETGFPGGKSTSSQQHSAIKGPHRENLGSPTTSRAFEGMLRTTTETGDIGFFSIKPSGIPQAVTGPRKIYQPPQSLPAHICTRDGRRNIPSHAQDASSEILSLYDTSSQKSVSQNSASQDLNYPHNRSYSATYSSSTLSNRRSYASLTSQMGVNGPLQRPRSPFAYPSRVKRPPRSCIAALVDGDGIAPHPRPDAERLRYEPDYSTLSPSSLHIRGQRPPTPSLRHNSNRSTPSLLGQASPSYRASTPNPRHSSGPAIYGWRDANGPVPVHVSPARSNFSQTATEDVQQAPPLHPVLNNATMDHPPSPLYYDYSEDFSSNRCAHPEIQEPLPQFHIGKTIPEDRQVSTDSHVVEDWKYSATESGFNPAVPTAPPAVDLPALLQGSQFIKPPLSGVCEPKRDEVHPMLAARNIQRTLAENIADNSRYDKAARPLRPSSGTQISLSCAEEQPVLSQLSAIENIDHHKPSVNGISQRQRSSNCNEPSLTREDDDLEPVFHDAGTSMTLNHKSLTYYGSCGSSSSPTPAFPDEKRTRRENLGDSTVPPSSLGYNESVAQNKKGHSRSNRINIDTIARPDYYQHDASSSPDQLLKNLTARSEHPTATSAGLALGLQNSDTQLKFNSTLSQSPFLSNNEELFPQPPLLSSGYEVELQSTTRCQNSSSRSPSFCGSEESRPLSSQNPDIEIQGGLQYSHYSNENPPKFRLKITRASDSILGTVRVNRTSADSKPLAALHLRDPRDLFTPSSGIDNIFRQVSRHLNVPGTSSGSYHSIIEWEQTPVLAPFSNQLPDNGTSSSNFTKPQHLTATANPLNPSDVQSFFSDDSSHFDGRRNLRKRLSNLRALVAIPYAGRHSAHSYDGSYSHDDNVWRDGIGLQHSNLLAARSADNLKDANTRAGSSRPRQTRARIHVRKMKEIVSGWFQGAKSVIVDRMKPGGHSYRGRREHNRNGP